MARALDKLVLLVVCLGLTTWWPWSVWLIVSGLLAVAVSALAELDWLARGLRTGLVLGYLGVALIAPTGLAFVPLLAYDCWRLGRWWRRLTPELVWAGRFVWVIPLVLGSLSRPAAQTMVSLMLGGLACLMTWRGERLAAALVSYRARRDALSVQTARLERRNRDLEERQSLELRLATLSERDRIAREIHDNVGHLLTRSVLQVEALQVVHAGQSAVVGGLQEVGQTLHQAYDTVRQSVHDLRDDSYDLSAQLVGLSQSVEGLRIQVDDGLAETPPPLVSRALLAIVRECVANTQRHSNATQLSIRLTDFTGFYQLVVHDNGSTPPSRLPDSGGIGLESMAERVRSLGGVLRTSWDHGFQVFASIPKRRTGRSTSPADIQTGESGS